MKIKLILLAAILFNSGISFAQSAGKPQESIPVIDVASGHAIAPAMPLAVIQPALFTRAEIAAAIVSVSCFWMLGQRAQHRTDIVDGVLLGTGIISWLTALYYCD